MQVEFIVNGGVSLLFSPENEAEEALLKQMMKQDNDLTEIRSAVTILSKTFRNGVLICKKSATKDIPGLGGPEFKADEGHKETV